MSEALKIRLYNHEVTPPANAWAKIVAALEEENPKLTLRLYNAEIIPPASSWNNIEAALNSDVIEEYGHKLFGLEVAPPANAWEKISSSLEEEETLPRISRGGRVIPIFKYAAAICMIALIGFGIKWLGAGKKTTGPVTTKITPPTTPAKTVQPVIKKDSTEQVALTVSNNLPKRNISYARNIIPQVKNREYMTQLASLDPQQKDVSSETNLHEISQTKIPGSEPMISSSAERYLTLTGPDGYLIRISRKLAETLGCLYNNPASTEYKQCIDQIRKWREKVAQSPVSPSPLDLIRSIEENKL
jgi:hypothetical protein